jgi:hypothetical protein
MTRCFLALTLILTGDAAFGQPESAREGLEQFYLAMNGDEWTRNDGWLDPQTEPCDWYGISCLEFSDDPRFYGLELHKNGLEGELDADLIDVLGSLFSDRLDLSGNSISGLEILPTAIRSVDLSHNHFAGSLPDPFRGDVILIPFPLDTLDLSDNRFEGTIPESWLSASSLLRLGRVDLSGNRLDGGLGRAFAALDPDRLTILSVADNEFSVPLPIDLMLEDRFYRLDFSGNAFSGEIPASLAAITELFPNQYTLGGLDLCWNDLQTAESVALHEWLSQFHVGVRYGLCLGPHRQPIERAISGSRFEPARAGEGTTMHLLDNGQALVYWFTYTEYGQQMWLTGMTPDVDFGRPGLQFDLIRPESFPSTDGGRVFDYPLRGEFRYDHLEDGRLAGLQIYDINISTSGYEPQPVGLRVDHVALTRLNGTHCEDDDLPRLSGVWHNPEIEADGFVVEVLRDRRAVVYWFTWEPDSPLQAWMIGTGVLDGSLTIQIDEMIRPTGGEFGQAFDPEAVVLEDWGSLTIAFDDESQAELTYSSNDERWGDGGYALERLSVPMLAECE